MKQNLFLDPMIDALKAIVEPSRLRILALLRYGDLTVSDLTTILGQSQPRVSRHLKLLHEAGIISRYQEGAWAYFRLENENTYYDILNMILSKLNLDDVMISLDMERLTQVKAERRKKADAYFSQNAQNWDELRKLHASDTAIEAAMLEMMQGQKFQTMLDIGTGTGTLLNLFAPIYHKGLGIDLNRDMLAVARVNLERAGVLHAQVQQADATALPAQRDFFDFITIYQVLHFLDEPQQAINEAARVLAPSGWLMIVDFASHNLDFLREEQAHRRLGFSDQQIKSWLSEAGLELKNIKTFDAKKDDANQLSVKIWLARDPRFLIAQTTTMETV